MGIIIAIFVGFTGAYFLATDKIQAAKSKGEVLVFRRGYIKTAGKSEEDLEEKVSQGSIGTSAALGKTAPDQNAIAAIHRQTKIFHWQDLCYDIKIKGNPRRLLDNVDGWVKPGTLTALMVKILFYIKPIYIVANNTSKGRIWSR